MSVRFLRSSIEQDLGARAIAGTSHNGAVQAWRLVMGHQPFPPEDALMVGGTV